MTTLADRDLGPGDRTDMAFMNTPVTHGSGVMIVTGTGAGTEVGKVSGLLTATKREQTPLTRQLTRMTQWIAVAALATMVVMFALGLARGGEWKALFVTAVALAIAAIPEALPTVVQVILSLGAVGLAKRNAIVKDLSSVETLGSTSAIYSDKTGTLTMNQMTAVQVVDPVDRYTISGTGYSLEGQVHHAAGSTRSIEDAILPFIIASDAELVDGKVVGDPTEGALLVLGHKAGLDIDATRERLPCLATLPFDPTCKLMATFNQATDADGQHVVRCFVKGAAPAVMGRAATALAGGTHLPWDEALKGKAEDNLKQMESDGLRVMAAVYRDLDPATFDTHGDLLGYVKDLELTCQVGMIDPPRDASRAAVASAQAAHIRVRMVTGDDVLTGAAIAKNAGRMILSDDNFATIVFAVEQGRKLYDNLLKYVRFIIITLVAFVGTFLGASLLNIAAGQPFTPVQILWINFLIDTPLGIALGFDRETPGLMRREPRPRTDSILKAPMLLTSLLTGLFMAVCLFGLIAYGANVEHHAVVGVTLAMSAFAWCRIVCTYESRSLKGSALTLSSFECRQINLIAIGEIVLAFLMTEWDLLNRLLGTTHISLDQRLLSWAPAVALLLLWELGKLIPRRMSHPGSQRA